MTINIAINGFGRIGRAIVRALSQHPGDLRLVAINTGAPDPSKLIANSAYLLKYDSVHGVWNQSVEATDAGLNIGGNTVTMTHHMNPEACPWGELDVDVVLECSGAFTQGDRARAHLDAGAKKVLISAPGSNVDATIVYGVNHATLAASHRVVSNASCTTNCLAPVVQVIDAVAGVASGLMNTIHAVTSDQALADGEHKDPRRGRAAMLSMIPTQTGAAKAIDLVLPSLAGRLDGFAVRVPTANVSLVDLTVVTERPTTIDAIHDALKAAASGPMQGVLATNTAPLVSIDFNGHTASSIVDLTQTRLQGQQLKVLAWYDNEIGFSNRMLDTALAMSAAHD